MWPFRRKPKGKHALGAAVSGIPSAPAVPTYVPSQTVSPAAALTPLPARAAVVEPELLAAPLVVEVPPAPVPVPVRGPRVELGFRDGSTAALAPGSQQAKALTDIASVLTRRD